MNRVVRRVDGRRERSAVAGFGRFGGTDRRPGGRPAAQGAVWM